ncbi:MAG: class I SAM-dependent methyltransferase [Clostridiales bacterium]|nr:class I SAM-dependent methyltransferase [Clostridiales bacterium]
MQNSYTALGSLFEYLNYDCDYEKWSQYLIEKLKEQKVGLCGVDIGCGNGYFTRALYKQGFDICGVDVSAEMLNKAKQIALQNGANIEFLLGDITKLKLIKKCDFAVAINDCLNYIPQSKLFSAFSHVAKNLKKGGVFIFDISSSYKLKNILANNLFCDDGEDITYVWFNKLKEDSVEMDLTFFIKGEDGKYTRADEKHLQYIHEEDELVSTLQRAGFEVIATEGHLGKEKTERINFICKKL